MTGTRPKVALGDDHLTSFILTCRAAAELPSGRIAELLPSEPSVLSAPQEDRVLFEVAVLDRRRAHLTGAVGAVVERGEGAVHLVEQLLGRPKEGAMLVRGEHAVGRWSSWVCERHRCGTLAGSVAPLAALPRSIPTQLLAPVVRRLSR
jgi:hypothetical protein